MTREQIVLRFAYLERLLATSISFPQPLLADHVWNIEQVKSHAVRILRLRCHCDMIELGGRNRRGPR